jgi:Natural resistance-associated macrophage protein
MRHSIPATAPGGRRQRRRFRSRLALLGPAFVAAIAYIDPGNFATNIEAGAEYGYTLLWVVFWANLMAVLIQLLSSKLGIATRSSLAAVIRNHLPPLATRPAGPRERGIHVPGRRAARSGAWPAHQSAPHRPWARCSGAARDRSRDRTSRARRCCTRRRYGVRCGWRARSQAPDAHRIRDRDAG